MRLYRTTMKDFLLLPLNQQEDFVKLVCASVKKHMIGNSNTVAIRRAQLETKASLSLVRYCMKFDEEIVAEGKRRTREASRGLSWHYWTEKGVDILPGAENVS